MSTHGVVRAAGAVVLRETTSGTDVALVHRDRYDDWTLPKGKLDPGELACEAAVREVAEETGLTIRLGMPLDRVTYQLERGDTKTVDYWIGTVLSQAHRPPDAEITAVEWVPVEHADRRLTHDHDRALLAQAVAQPRTTALVLLRHAKAVARDDWHDPDDEQRPLRSSGLSQAEHAVDILRAYGIGRIVSSTATRCLQTVQPYGAATGLPIDARVALSEPAAASDPDGHDAVLREIRTAVVRSGAPAVVCGHRPALPRALELLGIPERKLRTAQAAVAHLSVEGQLVAVEWQRADPM